MLDQTLLAGLITFKKIELCIFSMEGTLDTG